MGKGNTERRKTTLVRLENVEGVVTDLLEHIDTENLFDRLANVEDKTAAQARFLDGAMEAPDTLGLQFAFGRITKEMEDLADSAARARDAMAKLGARLDDLELWWWKRWWRKAVACLRNWS